MFKSLGTSSYMYSFKLFIVPDGSVVWRVTIDPMSEPGPYVITVTSGDESIKIDDVLFGEVWFCSGQSNMVHPMYQASTRF